MVDDNDHKKDAKRKKTIMTKKMDNEKKKK